MYKHLLLSVCLCAAVGVHADDDHNTQGVNNQQAEQETSNHQNTDSQSDNACWIAVPDMGGVTEFVSNNSAELAVAAVGATSLGYLTYYVYVYQLSQFDYEPSNAEKVALWTSAAGIAAATYYATTYAFGVAPLQTAGTSVYNAGSSCAGSITSVFTSNSSVSASNSNDAQEAQEDYLIIERTYSNNA